MATAKDCLPPKARKQFNKLAITAYFGKTAKARASAAKKANALTLKHGCRK